MFLTFCVPQNIAKNISMVLYLQNIIKPNIKKPHCDDGEWSVECLVITFASICMFRKYLRPKNHCHS